METKILTPSTYDIVRNAKRPEQTKSYQPVTHAELIDFVREKVDKMGLKIVNERYSTNKAGRQMFGEMSINCEDTDLRYALSFRNSHDKSLPVGFVSGAQVIVCSNLMLVGDIKQVRRHTTNILQDLDYKFELISSDIEGNFNKIKKNIELYKGEILPYEKSSELFGKILLKENKVASIQQVTKAIELFNNPLHDFGNDTVWGFTNAFTEAFKEAHPWRAPQNYLNLDKFLQKEFNFN